MFYRTGKISSLVRMLMMTCALSAGAFLSPALAVQKPQRIVSLNLCTDQLLMMLVDRKRIAAVSYLARHPESSVLADQAQSLPITYGGAEDVIMLKPDLILANIYSARATVNMLRKLKYNVVVIKPAQSLADIAKNITTIAKSTGEIDKGEKLVEDVGKIIKDYQSRSKTRQPTAAIVYANSFTSGGGTLANQVLSAGGFANLGQQLGFSGISKISLESLLVEKPEAIILEQPGMNNKDKAHEVFLHPVLKKIMSRTRTMKVASMYWVCGTPHTLKAIERIKTLRKQFGDK